MALLSFPYESDHNKKNLKISMFNIIFTHEQPETWQRQDRFASRSPGGNLCPASPT